MKKRISALLVMLTIVVVNAYSQNLPPYAFQSVGNGLYEFRCQFVYCGGSNLHNGGTCEVKMRNKVVHAKSKEEAQQKVIEAFRKKQHFYDDCDVKLGRKKPYTIRWSKPSWMEIIK